VGGGPGDEYSVDVEYWMAFFEGQGLHDAPWKSRFGGNIYKTDGSRGCVNLPTDIAKKVYEKSKEGMAIVIYKE
jgi:lipoprotein-anchoring transpeptidase ErfK/SrfK